MVRALSRALFPVAVAAAAAASGEVATASAAHQAATSDDDFNKFAAPFVGGFDKYAQKDGERRAADDFKGFGDKFTRDFAGVAHKAEHDGEAADVKAQRREAAASRKYVNRAKEETLKEGAAAKAEADRGTREISSETDVWFMSRFGGMFVADKDQASPSEARIKRAQTDSATKDAASAEQAKLAAEMGRYYTSQYASGYTNVAGKAAQSGTSAATADADAGLTEAQKAEQQAKIAEEMQKKWASQYMPAGVGSKGQNQDKYFAAQVASADQPQTLVGEPSEGAKPAAPRSADDCHTVAELKAWREAELKKVSKFVPKEYSHFATSDIESQFKQNLARIHKELEQQLPSDGSSAQPRLPKAPALPPLPAVPQAESEKSVPSDAAAPAKRDLDADAANKDQPPATEQLYAAVPQQGLLSSKAQRAVELLALPAFFAASVLGLVALRRRRAATAEDMSVYLMQP